MEVPRREPGNQEKVVRLRSGAAMGSHAGQDPIHLVWMVNKVVRLRSGAAMGRTPDKTPSTLCGW